MSLTNLTADFETYYAKDYTLKKNKFCDLSTSQYVFDPRFKAHMVGIKYDDQKAEWIPHDRLEHELGGIQWDTINLICHHTHFDGLILGHHYDHYPARYSDTLSLSRAVLQGVVKNNELDTIARFLDIGRKTSGLYNTKDKVVLTPEEYNILGAYCLNDVEITHDVYHKLVGFMPEEELSLIDLTIRMYTQGVFEVDVPRITTELNREMKNKADLLAEIPYDKKQLASNKQFAEVLESLNVPVPMKPSPTVEGKMTYAFAKNDMGFLALEAHDNEDVRKLVAARKAVKSTITETRIKRISDIYARGGRFPIYLNYWGAHTGRWSGGDKTNPQNFSRGSEMRKSIIAPEGKVLVVADSAQIEARVNAYISNQEDLLDAFREGRDVYSEMASTIYGRPVDRKRKEDHPDFDPEDALAGFVGKVAILGLGYNMGVDKFRHTLAVGAMGPPVIFSQAETARIVHAYRTKYYKIVANWKKLHNILYDMMNPTTDKEYEAGVRFTYQTCHLPNGTRIWYPGLRVRDDGDIVYKEGRAFPKLYGGKFSENITQAVARIVVADQMREIAKKYMIGLMAHDECVAVVDEDEADEALKFMLDVMSVAPDWCDSLPVAAEGGFAREYSK